MVHQVRHGYDPFPDARIRFNGETVRRKFIFNDEWVELYRAADVTERLILGLGASMGLRRREIVSIELDDIKGDKLYVKGKGAGTGKVEIMAMSELVRRDLGPYLEHRERVLSEYGDRSNGRLFINERMRNVGRPMSVRALETVLDGLVKRSGVSFSPHCLRRFFATTMKDAGVDLDTLRRMMRHSSIDTTLRCYIYADPRKMGAAVGAVDRAFGALV
jgi:integrase